MAGPTAPGGNSNLSIEQRAALAVEADKNKRQQRGHMGPPVTTPGAGGAMGPPRPPTYTYTPLADLKKGGKYNIYGVVVSFKGPVSTRGVDMMTSVTLIDPSMPNPQHGLQFILFGSLSTLPPINAAGQILRMHRIGIQEYQTKRQGISNRSTAYVVLSGRVGSDIGKDIAPGTSFDEKDFELVRDLRLWRRSVEWDNGYIKAIGELGPYTNYADLMVQVLSVKTTSTGTNDVCDLRVWDGTSNDTTTVTNPIYPEDFKDKLTPPTLDPDLQLGPGKWMGDILEVTAWGGQAAKFANCPLGTWLFIRNARISEKFGHLIATLETQATACQVKPEDTRVERLLTLYGERVTQAKGLAALDPNNASGPAQTLVPNSPSTIAYPSAPITNISDVLKNRDGIPAVYHIQAKVKYYVPMEAVDTCKYYCGQCERSSPLGGHPAANHEGSGEYKCMYCQAVASGDKAQFTWALRLTLTDDTGSLDAYVAGSVDGTLFFLGTPPQDLHVNPPAAHLVANVLSSLLIEEQPMDILIKAYRRADDASRVAYRVFGTKMVGYGS